MLGIEIRKANIVSSDERRDIIEIMNGELSVKLVKVLKVKKGVQLLGNHWHQGREAMYILKGSAKYRMKNIDTGEIEDYYLTEGDVVFRTGRIVHAGWFNEDSIIIDCGEDSYVSQEFNDIYEEILK